MSRAKGVRRLGALAVLSTAVTGCGAHLTPPPIGITQYVDMGDSYAAGPGLGPGRDACDRSGTNYGALIAHDLHVTTFTDVSCAGAKTTNLTQPQTRNGITLNDPQLDALSSGTDLVTLLIGLDDNGIAYQAAYLCLPGNAYRRYCPAYLRLPESTIVAQVQDVSKAVKDAIDAIRAQAPNARIVLIGYPGSTPAGRSCPAILPLSDEAAARLRLVLTTADTAYAQVASEEGIDYISTFKASAGHDICSATPWTNGATDHSATGQGANLHPRPAFMRAVADLVEKLVAEPQ